MKTSDKELDDLFASKLQGLEVGPAANLWQNISVKLDQKPKRKNIVPALCIAAGIVVILSVGLLFLQKQEPVKNQLPKKIVKVELQQKDLSKNQIKSLDDKNSILLLSAKNKVIKEALAKTKNKSIATKNYIKAKPKVEDNAIQTLVQVKPELKTESLQVNSTQAQIALVPGASVSLKPQPQTEAPQQTNVKPQLLAAVTYPTKTKHKRIRSIGDVVNLVMAQLDKRDDKLIQFTDSDDGEESNVTGINLGIINIKKEK